MKVVVSVHGRFHGFELATGLYQRGVLESLITTYPNFIVQYITGGKLPVKSCPHLEAIRRGFKTLKIKRSCNLFISKSFGEFISKNLNQFEDVSLLIGWSSATLEAILPAQKTGQKVIIERGSSHITEQSIILRDAYSEFNLEFVETESEMMEREEAEYELADKICVPSLLAARSFYNRGFNESKIIINPLAVGDYWFKGNPIIKVKNDRPRIIFAGGVGIRKGVPWLLRAFHKLSKKADLYLYGYVEKSFESTLHKLAGSAVKVCGPISAKNLAIEYRKADIFCLPSIEEGFGLSVLQAMASGLPVVITENVGASDIIKNGLDGFIVPPFNEHALRDSLEFLIDDHNQRLKMGKAAFKNVSNNWTLDNYITRSINTYNRVISD